MLSRLVITFLPRSKRLLTSWLQSPPAVILEPPKIKFTKISPRSGAAAERSNPTSKERWLRGCGRAERSHSMLKVRWDGGEEIPLIQGKEQWLHFAGAAVKRYPASKVREPK